MGIAEITQSQKWKVFMKYLYGWGAAVVLVGALFKLTHWPGATAMLTVGLLVEAGIFFLSAFEPLHEEVDWTLVYPELAGLEAEIPEGGRRSSPAVTTTASSPADTEAITKFNEMLEKAGETNVFEKFGAGIENLNQKVSQMSDISDASLATGEYAENMKNASESVKEFSEKHKASSEEISSAAGELAGAYKQSVDTVSYSTENLTDSFNKMNQKVSSSGDEFVQAYQQLTNSMDLDFSALQSGNSEYNEHIGKLNKNLSALNAIFELQLNEADLDKMMEDLQGSVKHSAKYHSEINQLGQKLEKLNNVYGNILAALNVKDA